MPNNPEFVYFGEARLTEEQEHFLSDLVAVCKKHKKQLYSDSFGRIVAQDTITNEKIKDITVRPHSCNSEFVLNCSVEGSSIFDIQKQLDIHL